MMSCNPTDDTRLTQWDHRQAFYNFSIEAHHFSLSRLPQPPPMNNSQQQEIHSNPISSVTKACPNCGFAFRVKQDFVSVNQEYCSKGLCSNYIFVPIVPFSPYLFLMCSFILFSSRRMLFISPMADESIGGISLGGIGICTVTSSSIHD